MSNAKVFPPAPVIPCPKFIYYPPLEGKELEDHLKYVEENNLPF